MTWQSSFQAIWVSSPRVLQFSELCFVVCVRDGARTQSVTQTERDVIGAHDLADFFEVGVEEVLLVMRKAPLCENGSATADNAGSALHGQGNVAEQNAGMDREIVHTLLGLLNQRVSIEFPGQFLRPPAAFLQRLVDGHGADRNRRVPQNPLSCLVDVSSGG